MKHKKISIHDFDEEPLYLSCLPTYYYHICCDCGLRHIIIIERYRKGVRIGFARDNHATKEIRGLKKIKVMKGGIK